MAAGKPVIASNVGGNPESVVEGVTGFLFDPNDSAALAAKIILLARDPDLRSQMGLAAKARANETFSTPRMVMSYERLYELLLSAKSSASRCRTKPAKSPFRDGKSSVLYRR